MRRRKKYNEEIKVNIANRPEEVSLEASLEAPLEAALEAGEELEEETVTFAEAGVHPAILRAVEELGFSAMTPIQVQAIPLLMQGKDVIGQAQTGTGKTAAFGIPLLQSIDPTNKEVQAIILCPTRELAMQAADDLRSYAKFMHGIKVLPVYGGQDIRTQIRQLKGTQIIVGTPGRVMDHMRRHTIKMQHVYMVVLDEADEMLDMGFREDMEVILGAIEQEHQTCLFSATMPEPILELAGKYQKDPELVKITKKELTVNTIKQYYYPVKKEYKNEALHRILAYYHYDRCVVFCNTKSMVSELVEELQERGFAAEGLHGDLSQNMRDTVMGRFRGGTLQILVATDIPARGIDVENVEAVINYDIPQETEYYVHRIGRTGRAGKEGASHTLCRSFDFRKIRDIERICHSKMEERMIPTPEEITSAREKKALEKAIEVLTAGKSGKYIPSVKRICEEYQITAEELAAAFLKEKLGDDLENLQISLPEKKEPRRGRRLGKVPEREGARGGAARGSLSRGGYSHGGFSRGLRDSRDARDARDTRSSRDSYGSRDGRISGDSYKSRGAHDFHKSDRSGKFKKGMDQQYKGQRKSGRFAK